MDCIIGIDGGGTKALLKAINLNGEFLCEVKGGSTNLASNSAEQVRNNLTELFKEANIAANETLKPLSICLGTAGVTAKDADKILKEILFDITGCKNLSVVGDMEIPLYADCADKDGVVVIAGTGSIAFARTKDGKTARAGGWGHIVSDEGSAYWIAKEAIVAIMRAYDGRGLKTCLEGLFTKALDCDTKGLISKIHAPGFNKSDFAALAGWVNEGAMNGDTVSIDILHRAAEFIIELLTAAKNRAELSDDFTLILAGGVLTNNKLVQEYVIGRVGEEFEKATVINAQSENITGALTIAKRQVI